MVGRPRIGEHAMTSAERVRRYRLKHGISQPVTKPAEPVTKPAAPEPTAPAPELVQAEARIRELEAEIERLKGELVPQSMRKRYEGAIRRARLEIRHELMTEVHAEVFATYQRLWKPDIERAERIIAAHNGVISRKDYRIVLAGLHPDHNKFEQAREAFETFRRLEDVLVKPDPPALRPGTPPLPQTVEELLAQRKTRRRT